MKNKTILLILILATYQIQSQTKVKVKLHSIKDYLGYEDFAKEASKLLEKVINSKEFRDTILKSKFKKTNGLSNKELLNKIIQAQEVQGSRGTEHIIDLKVRTLDLEGKDSKWKKTVIKARLELMVIVTV